MALKTKLTVLLLSLLPCAAYSQSVSYAYDAAGNRVKREIVLQTRAAESKSMNESFQELLDGRCVNIHPNPTEGHLIVELGDIGSDELCELCLVNTSGQQIMSISTSSNRAELDISSQPRGMYLLRISIGNNSTVWKIIKK